MTKTFTDQQQAIIEHRQGHALVNAVAGSGKTSVLVEHIAHRIAADEPADRIVAVQFNKSAQLQFDQRLKERMDGGEVAKVYTLHSLGNRILRRLVEAGQLRPFRLNTSGLQLERARRMALRNAWRKSNGSNTSPTPPDYDRFGEFVTLVKSQLSDPRAFFRQSGYDLRLLPFIDAFHAFEEWRLHHNIAFFDDLIYDVYRVLGTSHYDHLWSLFNNYFDTILVDEAQDLNPIQYWMVKKLAGDRATVMLVGDPKQAIYSWRGSAIDIIQREFQRDFAPVTVFPMTYTFRHGPAVALAANHVIMKNVHQNDDLTISHPSTPNSIVRRLSSKDMQDSGLVANLADAHREGTLRDSLMLVRYFSQTINYEMELLGAGIPYFVHGREGLTHVTEVAAMVTVMALATNHWPVPDEARPTFIRAMLMVPSAYLTSEELNQLVDEMTIISLKRPERIGEPLAAMSRRVEASNRGKANLLTERYQALTLLVSGSLAKDKPDTILGVYLKMTGLYDDIIDSSAVKESERESIAIVKAFLNQAGSQDDTREFLDALGESAAMERDKPPDSDYLPIMSIHGAKGLEADRVFLAGMAEGSFPRKARDGSNEEEERRLAYVGITRARKELVFLHPHDEQLEKMIKDPAWSPPKMEDKAASSYLYDAELGVSLRVAQRLARDHPDRFEAREPRIATRYLDTIRCTDIKVEQAANAVKALVPLTPSSAITRGMKVYSERFGECEVVKRIHGAVYYLRRLETDEMVHDKLIDNGWSRI